jgi:hypothetical protein
VNVSDAAVVYRHDPEPALPTPVVPQVGVAEALEAPNARALQATVDRAMSSLRLVDERMRAASRCKQ